MSSRTYESGAAKRKRAKRIAELTKSQKGDIRKFMKSNTGVSINPNDELTMVAVEEEQQTNVRKKIKVIRINYLICYCL